MYLSQNRIVIIVIDGIFLDAVTDLFARDLQVSSQQINRLHLKGSSAQLASGVRNLGGSFDLPDRRQNIGKNSGKCMAGNRGFTITNTSYTTSPTNSSSSKQTNNQPTNQQPPAHGWNRNTPRVRLLSTLDTLSGCEHLRLRLVVLSQPGTEQVASWHLKFPGYNQYCSMGNKPNQMVRIYDGFQMTFMTLPCLHLNLVRWSTAMPLHT